MSQTILSTGASSGIGRASATLFADRGWNVVATMRNTDDGVGLADRDNVLVTPLDLLDKLLDHPPDDSRDPPWAGSEAAR